MNVGSRTIWATSKRGSPSLRILACPTAFRTPSLLPDVSGGTPGLTGTIANHQLFLFDPKGRLAVGGFFVNGVATPSNRTGFFIQLSAGSAPAGRFTWLMVIFDAFGNTLATPFQALPRPMREGGTSPLLVRRQGRPLTAQLCVMKPGRGDEREMGIRSRSLGSW